MKIVLTGGPSAGKTTIAMSIVREFCEKVVLVPETASILFKGGFQRRTHDFGVEHQQMAIYHTQVAHETIIEYEHPKKIIICDRGTLDGLAYWPEKSQKNFLEEVGTHLETEINRYDWVIHLDIAGTSHYNSDQSTIRIESREEAEKINERIKTAWELHPKKLLIPTTSSFAEKIEVAHCLVDGIIKNKYPHKLDQFYCQ